MTMNHDTRSFRDARTTTLEAYRTQTVYPPARPVGPSTRGDRP